MFLKSGKLRLEYACRQTSVSRRQHHGTTDRGKKQRGVRQHAGTRLLFALLLLSSMAYAQSPDAPLNAGYYQLLERYEVRSGRLSASLDTQVKPYSRQAIGRFLDSLDYTSASVADRFNMRLLTDDNHPYVNRQRSADRKPLLKHLYKHQRDFWSVDTPGLQLSVNPVLHLQAGQDRQTGLTYINTRGIQLEGVVDKKVGFYTYIGENQMLLPAYVNAHVRKTLTLPQEGFWKGYGERGVDFLTARGHFSFQATPHIGMQLGHGKHFIGSGYRSLVLSDFANNYLYFRINTQVWRLHYTNIFAKMTADVVGNPTGLYGTVEFPAKYFTFHRLGIHLGERLNIGLFESIVHGDSSQRFDITYLNPVIFYRPVEQQGGSKGNALLGIDFKWLTGTHISFYGQALIDEFVMHEMRAGQGWWGNKYAMQLGLKYIDMFNIPNLDLQLEYNRVRPYTYAHEDLYRSYSHYEQPLAHPLGANFREALAIFRYQPVSRLQLEVKFISAVYGADTAASNWGNNILLDNRERQQEYGNLLGQGTKTHLSMADCTVSYQPWQHLYLDVRYIGRQQQQPAHETGSILSGFIAAGIRLNMGPRDFSF